MNFVSTLKVRVEKTKEKVKEKVRIVFSNSESVRKVAEATNGDPWGPTGTQMDELAEMFPAAHVEISAELHRALEMRRTDMRKCYKALLIIDHLARNVPKLHVEEVCGFLWILKEISSQPRDSDEKYETVSVRERAQKLVSLLSDEDLLNLERKRACETRKKIAGEHYVFSDDNAVQKYAKKMHDPKAPSSAESKGTDVFGEFQSFQASALQEVKDPLADIFGSQPIVKPRGHETTTSSCADPFSFFESMAPQPDPQREENPQSEFDRFLDTRIEQNSKTSTNDDLSFF